MNKPIITMKDINKLKEYKYRIFEAEDDDFPDRRIVARNRREIDKILSKYTEEQQIIIDRCTSWANDNCAKELIDNRFEIVYEK